MLRTVTYGPHKITPWCPGTGYVDTSAKNLKSYRSREPAPIWQSLISQNEDLGEYDLYVCRHCFLYSSKKSDVTEHEKYCRYKRGNPGKLVYEDSEFRYYEVQIREAHCIPTLPNGKLQLDEEEESLKLYLQCLSLMGHLFLDTKSILFSVDGFFFYTAVDKRTDMVAGFFSKEKHSWFDYNLACIVIFPPWQKRGLGRKLIRLSYLLIQKQHITGSPEKPLSAHGKLAYEAYWCREIAKYMATTTSDRKAKYSVARISTETSIDQHDVWNALKHTQALQNKRLKVKLLLNRKKQTIPSKLIKREED